MSANQALSKTANFERKETDFMKNQDKEGINNPQPVIEDLIVNQVQAADVKGGSSLGGRPDIKVFVCPS